MKAPKNQAEASHRAYEMVNGHGVPDYGGTTLIDVRAVAEMIGASRSTVWRRVRDKSLPAPVRLHGLTRWSRAEVEAAIEAMLANRDDAEAA